MGPHLHYKGSNDHHIMLKPTQLTLIHSNYVSLTHNIQFHLQECKNKIEDNDHAESYSWVPTYTIRVPMTITSC